MSLPRPSGLSGLKPPTSRLGRPTGLPAPKSQGGSVQTTPSIPKPQSGLAKPGRGLGFVRTPAQSRYSHEPDCALMKGPDPPSEDGSVNTDDFKIGDRIWVSGTKPGVIAFIGETGFAPGEWAGIVLDDSVGKNDGSVMGTRYFQCEPKRGVFSRLTKLFHSPQSPGRTPSQGYDSSSSEPKSLGQMGAGDGRLHTPTTTNGTPAQSTIPPRPASRLGMSSSKHLSTSQTSLNKGSSGGAGTGIGAANTTAMRLPGTMPGGVKVGDRVLVSGSKPGVLRYIGETDFAKGVWAGVELDDPLGKNDGAVAGKRYFECKPLHGLFAPVHKIARGSGSTLSTPSPHSRPLMSTSLRSSRERSGSQESVSSISSTASSVSRSRVRLGVTSLANQASKTGQRPSTLNLSATTAALQKALKEKEEHIEQLLRERDLERSEVARAAAHVDEAEGQLSSMKSEKERLIHEADGQISSMRTRVTEVEGEKQDLLAHLEEEKRKVEDLQFQLEEEALKDEGDSKVSELQLKEVERQAKKEKDRADKLEEELQQIKEQFQSQQKCVSEAEEAQTNFLDQIEELTYKLTQAETKVKAFETVRLEEGAKTSQVGIELVEKTERVKELEDLLASQRQDVTSLTQQLNDVRDELGTTQQKCKRQDDHIEDITRKLKEVQDEHKQIMDELRNANSSSADLQRQLAASQAKAEELAGDKSKLEEQMSELMKNSGDSSSQLASLNDQLMEKNRKIEDLQNDLSNYSQNLAKAEESYQELERGKSRELEEMAREFEATRAKLEEDNRDLNGAIEKSKNKIVQLTENFEAEKKEVQERKDNQIKELQQELNQTTEELNTQKDQTTACKQLLEKVNNEKDEIQYAKSQAEKLAKRMEGEKAVTNTELIQAKVEVTKLTEELGVVRGGQSQVEDKVERLTLELEYTNKEKLEIEKSRDEALGQNSAMTQEKDSLQQQVLQLRGETQTKDIRLEELKKELDQIHLDSQKKAEELMQKSQTDAEFMSQELDSLQSSLQDMTEQVKRKDEEMATLQDDLVTKTKESQDRDLLAREKMELMKEQESAQDRCRDLIKEVEKQSQKADQLQSEVKVLQTTEGALKREKTFLEDRVSELNTQLEAAKIEASEAAAKLASATSSMSGDELYERLREDAESAQGQVNFLNSVIVELQNKNGELEQRLAAMEDSGIHTNGDDFNDSLEMPRVSRAPPRLFCDICDVFDRHDTEDCPMQAMSESPEPSRHHGDPKNVRPYCEICEAFGHWTDDCEDEETF